MKSKTHIKIINEKKFNEIEHQNNFIITDLNGVKVAIPKKQLIGDPILINQKDLDVDFDNSFCEINPQINKFASESPDNLFFVLFLAMASKGISWPDFRDMMPVLAKFIKQTNGTVDRIEHIYDLKGKKRTVAGWFRTSHALLDGNLLWKNRKTLYRKIYDEGYINDTLKLYIYLSNIRGLSTVKAAFCVQLIKGELGCVDNINTDLYGFPVEIANFTKNAIGSQKIAKKTLNKMKTEEPSQKGLFVAEKYIEFLNNLAIFNKTDDISKVLWDQWVQLSAAKAFYQGQGFIQVKKINGEIIAMPTYNNKKTTMAYRDELRSRSSNRNPYGAGDISADHLRLPQIAKDLKKVNVENVIYNIYEEILKEYLT